MTIPDARELAVRAHGNQQDRDGSFHIDHVSRVAQGVATSDAHQRVAWLHDVVEDSGVSIEDMASRPPDAEIRTVADQSLVWDRICSISCVLASAY